MGDRSSAYSVSDQNDASKNPRVVNLENILTSEQLNYALQHGIIDTLKLQQQIEMEKRKEIIAKYLDSIWVDKNGKFCIYLKVGKRRMLRRRKTRRDLENVIFEYELNKDRLRTIEDVFNEWNDWKLELGKICCSTYLRNQTIFNQYYSEFGQRTIGSTNEDMYRDFLERLIPKHGMTAKSFSNLKSITRGFLKWAKRQKYISWNYDYMLSNVEVSSHDFRKVVKEDFEEVYDEEETRQMMDFLMRNPDPINLGILLMFVTGLRVGELSTLKHSDFKDGCIQIRRTETEFKDGKKRIHAVKEFPKSAAGWRDVVLPTDYLWILDELVRLNPEGEYIFEKKHKRCHERTFEARLKRNCDKLGIYPKSPHKIRKTYGTILMDNGIDTNMIIQQMGHTAIATSERYYHRNRKDVDRKRSILDGLDDFSKSIQTDF